jgi:hypothetical protein
MRERVTSSEIGGGLRLLSSPASIEGVEGALNDYAASGNCYTARLLLSLLGREHERVAVDIFAGDTLTEKFATLSPARETPALESD